MKYYFLLLSIATLTLMYGGNKMIRFFYYLEEVNFHSQENYNRNQNQFGSHSPKRILLVNSAHGIFGGAEMYTLSLYKNLVKNGHLVKLLLVKDSQTEKTFSKQKISHFFQNYKKKEKGKWANVGKFLGVMDSIKLIEKYTLK